MTEVVQVQLTDDGSRPVDLPTQFATVKDMAESYTAAQAKITELSTPEPTEPVTPTPKAEPKSKLPVEVQSALENIANFNEGQRKVRFEAQVGTEGLAALEDFIGGQAIDAGMKAAYEAAIDSGNEALIDANFALIRSTFEAQNGAFQAPQNAVAGVAGGGVIIPAGTKPFGSLDEQLAAQGDKKYSTDPTFRQEVEQRIAISGPYRV